MSNYLIFVANSDQVIQIPEGQLAIVNRYPVDSIMYDPYSDDGPWFLLTQFTLPRVLAWDPIHVSEVPDTYRVKALLLL